MASNADIRKNRIIMHMNDDHKRELAYYLRHYAHVSASAASSPEMRDMDLNHMLIRSRDGKDHTVSFNPPLTSWADAKTRVIEMANESREALGLSDIVITEFTPPHGFGAFVLGAVLFYFFCAAAAPWIVPATRVWELLDVGFPGGALWFRWVVDFIFWPIIGIHLFECILFDQKLQKHGVERLSGLWWTWEAVCFFEGFPSFKRLNAIVTQKTEGKNAKKQ